jgi:AraC family transcriptional regulator
VGGFAPAAGEAGVLRTRLHRAAVQLARSDQPVAAIAFEAGFNDLSTFNRRFRRLLGSSPTAYRARAGTASSE